MREPEEERRDIYVEEPCKAFDEIDEILMWAEYPMEYIYVQRDPWGGDKLIISMTYTNPEGRQVDVDDFRPTYNHDTWTLDFGVELPEE